MAGWLVACKTSGMLIKERFRDRDRGSAEKAKAHHEAETRRLRFGFGEHEVALRATGGSAGKKGLAKKRSLHRRRH